MYTLHLFFLLRRFVPSQQLYCSFHLHYLGILSTNVSTPRLIRLPYTSPASLSKSIIRGMIPLAWQRQRQGQHPSSRCPYSNTHSLVLLLCLCFSHGMEPISNSEAVYAPASVPLLRTPVSGQWIVDTLATENGFWESAALVWPSCLVLINWLSSVALAPTWPYMSSCDL